MVDQSSKDEEELATFWRESEELVFSAPNGHKLKDIAKYEVTVKNTLPSHLDLADIEAEKKVPWMNILRIKPHSSRDIFKHFSTTGIRL